MKRTCALLGLTLTSACASNLSTLQTARPVAPGRFQMTSGAGVYVPAGQMGRLIGEAVHQVDQLRQSAMNHEPVQLTEEDQQRLITLGLALALLPPSTGYEIGVRTGIVNNLDVGLRYSVSALRLDAKYRLLHVGDEAELPLEGEVPWTSHPDSLPPRSVATRSFDVALGVGVSRAFFSNPVFEVLGYLQMDDFSRWDFEVPLYVSWELGRVFKLYGGAKYIYSRVTLDGRLVKVFEEGSARVGQDLQLPSAVGMHYFGGTAGIGVGYRWIHLLLELNVGYTQAKTQVFGQERELGGLTLYPSAGLQWRF